MAKIKDGAPIRLVRNIYRILANGPQAFRGFPFFSAFTVNRESYRFCYDKSSQSKRIYDLLLVSKHSCVRSPNVLLARIGEIKPFDFFRLR